MVCMVPDGVDLTANSSRMVVPEGMTEIPDMDMDMGMDHMAIMQGLGGTQLLIIIITTVIIPPMERWVDAEDIQARISRRRMVIVTVMAADMDNSRIQITAHMDTIVATPEEEIVEDTISIFQDFLFHLFSS